MGNAYFKHRSLHKYTRVARGQNGVEIKIDGDGDISSAGEETYAAICAGCEGDKRNGTRPLGPRCCTL